MLQKIVGVLLIFFSWGWSQEPDFYTNRLLIALQPDAHPLPTGKVSEHRTQIAPQIFQLMQKHRVVRVTRWLLSADENDVYDGVDFSKVYRFYFERSSRLAAAAREFKALPEVQQVTKEPKIKIEVAVDPAFPNDPYLKRQYYLNKIMAPYVWSLLSKVEEPQHDILIGIVDTGIDYLHPEMADVLYINPGEDLDGDGKMTAADSNGIDDDGNGFIDDVRGWDFSAAEEPYPGDNDIRPPSSGNQDILSHGTHVAGIAGAMANNEQGISGIARKYKIIGTKHSRDTDYTHGYLFNAYDGILYCAKMGAVVINCSWGSTYYSEFSQTLVNMVRDKYGSIIVAAAGNDNSNNDQTPHYPSDLQGVIAVAALAQNDQRAFFSNYGRVIDISAPGVGLFSTIHFYRGGYATFSGTSMASPVVAGTIALVKYFFPNLSPFELEQKVLNAADPIDQLNPAFAGLLGSGRVNAYNAIAPDFVPAIQVMNDTIQIDDLNQNNQIDPGETVKIGLQLANKLGWRSAFNLKITARTNDSLIYRIDSTGTLDFVGDGEQPWTAPDEFVLLVDPNHPYGQVDVSFLISGETENGQSFQERYDRPLMLTMYQTPFPKPFVARNAPVSVVVSPEDSSKRLVFITADHRLMMLNAQGNVVAPFPLNLGEFHRVPQAIGDVNGDAQPEIIVLSNYGRLRVFALDGSLLLDKDLDEVVYGSFAVADLDGNGAAEIIIATMRKRLHVIKMDGSEWDGFPVTLSSIAPKGVAVADVNDDGLKEILLGTFDAKLHLFDLTGNECQGWPVVLPSAVNFTPVIAKDKNGVFLGVITKNNRLLLLQSDGNVKLETVLRADVLYDPFLMDWNNDGALEFSFVNKQNEWIAFDSQNKRFSKVLADAVNAPPLFFYANDSLRLLTVNAQGAITVYNSTLTKQKYTPIFLPFTLKNVATIDDLDRDGDAEAIVLSNDQLVVLDLPEPFSESRKAWSTYLGNEQRTATFVADTSRLPTTINSLRLPEQFMLRVYPNPFNSSVKIQLKRPRFNSNQEVTIKIYNIQGRLVKTLGSDLKLNTDLVLFWKGTNEHHEPVSSGIYLLKVDLAGHGVFVKRLVYLK